MNNTDVMIEYETRIVAFLDILGFKNIIENSEFDRSKIDTIYKALQFLKDRENSETWNLQFIEIEEDAQKKGVKKFDIVDKISCTCFSDSILVSVKVEDDNVNEMTSTLISHLSFVGAELMTRHIILRGAITIGKIIHNNGIAMGKGLIEAYNLETSSANVPRIILSDKLLSRLNYPILGKKDRYPYHQYLTRFDDGCVGFHQMVHFQVIESCMHTDSQKLKQQLSLVKDAIIAGLDDSFEDPSVYGKFKWLSHQYHKLLIIGKNIKERLYDLNEGTSGANIHYTHTNNFYKRRDKK